MHDSAQSMQRFASTRNDLKIRLFKPLTIIHLKVSNSWIKSRAHFQFNNIRRKYYLKLRVNSSVAIHYGLFGKISWTDEKNLLFFQQEQFQ